MTTSPLSPARIWSALFILLLALGGLLRLLDLTDPPLDFHTSRQLRNSLVAREIYYNALPSATDEQRQLATSFANAVGKYEPPVIETIVAYSYFLTGGENIAVARIWMTFFWLAAGVALFDLMRRIASPWAALIALAYYFVLPFSVQVSRSFQPDPLMTSAFVIGVYFLYRWSEDNSPLLSGEGLGARSTWKWAILAAVFLGLATFVKIVIAFMAGAAAIALVLFTLGRDFWKSKQVWAMAAIMVVPALLFYVFLNQGRSTEYFFAWTLALMKLITSTDFYTKWLAFLGTLFGLTIVFLGIAGALIAPSRMRWLLIGLWIGYLLYGLTLPFQMYTHSYYHIQLIPLIVLGLAVALNPLTEYVAGIGGVGRVGFITLVVVVIGYQAYAARSVLVAEDFQHEPAFWSEVGDAFPTDAHVIALTQDYGYRLMMYGWRKVDLWPLATELSATRNPDKDNAAQFDELTAGMDYFLVTAFGQLDKQPGLKKILDTYPIAIQGDGYVLYDLRAK
ncbi:MAG: glycosyltransferase family 39 protein [Anaerolineales bacterium]|uniref:ArnT family glycosyltransferase n=1 Tax=Candidatus Villigracilis vicinus TaxID=3140679 RepID=UPI0031357773|nr:glycosyltransferase family 39 protein [Anaerolineales bacterium]